MTGCGVRIGLYLKPYSPANDFFLNILILFNLFVGRKFFITLGVGAFFQINKSTLNFTAAAPMMNIAFIVIAARFFVISTASPGWAEINGKVLLYTAKRLSGIWLIRTLL